MMWRMGMVIGAVLALAGCADTLRSDPYAERLAPGEGVLELPAAPLAALRPKGAEVATMPGRLEERYRFPAGFVEFERLDGDSYFLNDVEGPSYRALFLGVSVATTAVPAHVLEPRRRGAVSYAPVLVDGQPCLSFRRALGKPVALGRAALAVGVLCRPSGDATPEETFLDHALAFAEGLEMR